MGMERIASGGALRFQALVCALLLAQGSGTAQKASPQQPTISTRAVQVIQQDGLRFRDLNRNGRLDPFEDWRLSPEVRTADLLRQMSLEEKAGLMVHGTLPSFGPLGVIGVGDRYDLDRVRSLIDGQKVTTFITRANPAARQFAEQNNAVQEIAEKGRFAIPVTISTDPRNHFTPPVVGASVADATFSQWPSALGLGAIADPAVTRRFADVVRQEYLATGIRESLAPQADLLTEPRWARSDGTFGADARLDRALVEAYVAGVQHGEAGLNPGSVLAVVKHWVGYGAVRDGWDSHNFYGRFAAFPGHNFQQHVVPFEGAFSAHVGSVMPTYAILQGVELNGKPVEPVGAGFNRQLLTGLLRGTYGFRGAVVSDWAITNDCNARCQNGVPAGQQASPAEIGMPWGVEQLTVEQRFSKAINAGVDQIGGSDDSGMIVSAVHDGLISQTRVDEAAGRILLQKFQMGLFENPYVDEGKAAEIAGSPAFVAEGRAAQARACVLLKNAALPSGQPVLPLAAGTRVFLSGLGTAEAERHGLHAVSSPAEAEVVLIHAPAPFHSEHPGYFFGSRQHEGRLFYTADDPAFRLLQSLPPALPVVWVTTLDRPAILTGVASRAAALVGDFGIEDSVLLDLLTGKRQPAGHLPFNLPRSQEAVTAQKGDVPDDDADPLYRRGFGMQYGRTP